MEVDKESKGLDGTPQNPTSSADECSRIAKLKADVSVQQNALLEAVRSSLPSQEQWGNVRHAIQMADSARKRCIAARVQLKTASDYYRQLQTTWNEIGRRQKVLLRMKLSLTAVKRLRNMAQTITDARVKGDHVLMSKSCISFESLNTSGSVRMDEAFSCLHSISERVSLAVALSMRMLRASLRACCKKFDPSHYAKCMMDFQDLGAAAHFPSHVLQVFEQEANQIYDDVMALQARSTQKGLSFPEENLKSQMNKIRLSMLPIFEDRILPFRHFAALAVRVLSEQKFSLLTEQTTTLLQVLEAANSFCDLAIVGTLIPGRDKTGALKFRLSSQNLVSIEGESNDRTDSIRLRRGGSQSRIVGVEDSQQQRTSTRRSWDQDLHQPIHQALKELASDCLSASHARHAEELKMITATPESWIRVRLSEKDLCVVFKELFHGLSGKLNTGSSKGPDEMTVIEEFNPGSSTFTTASLAMMRWVSEYATIGAIVPQALPDALSNITDMFLILLYTSVDMKSRIDNSGSESVLKFMEDVLLERHDDKSIEDFIGPAHLKPFRVFLQRYGEDDYPTEDESIPNRNDRWGPERETRLPHYSLAAGHLFANPVLDEVLIVRQCVAAEAIGTFCDVLLRFSKYLAAKVQIYSNALGNDGAKRLASVRAATSLGGAVKNAFYSLLAWDIIGGWEAVSAVAETCRLFHEQSEAAKEDLATESSEFVREMFARIRTAYAPHTLPPEAAERMNIAICETAMDVVLEGISRVRYCTHTAAASQILVDIRTLDLALVEYTGLHPCPGRVRTEMYVKATFLNESEIREWVNAHQRKLKLSDSQVKALVDGSRQLEIPIIEQIITP